MADDHITLRISKKTLLLTLVLVLVPGAFVAGLTVGSDSESSSATTTTDVPTTTIVVTTTSRPPTSAAVQSNPTTTVKKKKVAATTTTTTTTTAPPEALDVVATYSDNCPPSLPANASVPGKMTITWRSTSAVRALVEVIHGADLDYEENNHKPNDMLVLDRLCNNVREANGSYQGRPLTVIYRVTVYGADGKTAQDGGNDSM